MANKSNWKSSEKKAAELFPGGIRRPRVGGTYAKIADDVIWGPELERTERVQIKVKVKVRDPKTGRKKSTGKTRKMMITQPRVIKRGFCEEISPIYIESKKRNKSETVRFFRESEKKYFQNTGDRLVLVQHVLGEHRQFATVDGDFFKELIRAWCMERNLFTEEINKENENGRDLQCKRGLP